VHEAALYHFVVEPLARLADHLEELPFFLDQQLLSFLEPTNTASHLVLGELFVEAEADIEVPLPEAIERRVWGLRGVEAHERTFGHVE
jgi:hypothetical protein